ncbi:MAG: stage II sporulation protein R [Clostridia bacterium]
MRRGCLFLCLLALCWTRIAVAQTLEEALQAREMIRLHVIAHSDAAEDQSLKLQIRDALLAQCGQALACASYDEACIRLVGELAEMEACAQATARAAGYEGSVRVSFGMRDFPTRAYDDVVVPAGSYQAVCVAIGDAWGLNLWCVMYKQICLLAPTLPHAEQAARAPVQFESVIVRWLKAWGWIG